MKVATMAIMVLLLGSGLRHGQRFIIQATGGGPSVESVEKATGVKFSNEETDLMTTVLKSAFRLFSGSATRDQLSSELSDKLYAGHGDKKTMSELGIELVKPGADPSSTPEGMPSTANPVPAVNAPPGAKLPARLRAQRSQAGLAGQAPGTTTDRAQSTPSSGSSPDHSVDAKRDALLARVWAQMKPYTTEMMLVPVVFLGMTLFNRRFGKAQPDDFVPASAVMPPPESEPFDLKHDMHKLTSEDFETLVALIYQRQGYRVSMVAGLSGGRGGDFMLLRKSERILVQCKKVSVDHRIAVERVRELQEAMAIQNATRGMYVASCGFSWDGRNFAKANGITVINARTLDELITAARETPDEDLLNVAEWAPKFMSKVQLTPPQCPACESAMDQLTVSNGAVWVCSQRPECRGRRPARKYQKAVAPVATRTVENTADNVSA